jgi:hypothetical protein
MTNINPAEAGPNEFQSPKFKISSYLPSTKANILRVQGSGHAFGGIEPSNPWPLEPCPLQKNAAFDITNRQGCQDFCVARVARFVSQNRRRKMSLRGKEKIVLFFMLSLSIAVIRVTK